MRAPTFLESVLTKLIVFCEAERALALSKPVLAFPLSFARSLALAGCFLSNAQGRLYAAAQHILSPACQRAALCSGRQDDGLSEGVLRTKGALALLMTVSIKGAERTRSSIRHLAPSTFQPLKPLKPFKPFFPAPSNHPVTTHVLEEIHSMTNPFLRSVLTSFLAFLLVSSLSSCEKDELTKPVEVNFAFKLDRIAPAQADVFFTAGSIELQSITFTGDRDTGEDVTFMSDFETVVFADLITGFSDPAVKFDIPQGTYKSIRLLIDPDDIAPDIVINGQYTPAGIALPVPIEMHMEFGGALNLEAKTPDGNSEIVLRKDTPATVEVFLNPSSWFTTSTLELLSTADVQLVGNVPSIIISKNMNANIYANLAALVERSAEAIIK